jgi:probable phosphoglycerate mutase
VSLGRFWFVRHGETEFNRRGVRCGGDCDIPLNARGEEQARAVGRTLAGHAIGLIVTSPLMRTQRTAALIAEAIGGAPVESEPLFLERRLGDWNGLSLSETEPLIRARQTPPGGESETEFRERIERAVRALRSRLSRRVLVVSSKGVARVLNELAGNASRRPPVANAEVIELEVWPDRPEPSCSHF